MHFKRPNFLSGIQGDDLEIEFIDLFEPVRPQNTFQRKMNRILAGMKTKTKQIGIGITVGAIPLTFLSGILTCGAIAQAGEVNKTSIVKQETGLSVPGAGIGQVVTEYVDHQGKSSIEYLSTNAVTASVSDEYNPYYDGAGNTLGKYIVYTGEASAVIYDKIPGNERVETGEAAANVLGYLPTNGTVTLLKEQGDWYEILSGSVRGYVRKDGFVTGEQAETMDAATYANTATVNQAQSCLYAEPDWQSTVLCVLPEHISYTILEGGDPYSRIYVDGVGEGWALNDTLQWATERIGVSTVQELEANNTMIEAGRSVAAEIEAAKEAERIAAEEAAALAAQQAQAAAAAYQQQVTYPTPTLPADDIRQQIADFACGFAGWLPYVWAGASLETGADCCGFTMAVYNRFGYGIARTVEGQACQGRSVSMAEALPGDLVIYGGHVALYIGNGMIVHSPVPGQCVTITNVSMMPVYDIRRIIE